MKRNVIILLTVAAVVLSFALAGAWAIAGGESASDVVILAERPVRVVEGHTYIVEVPPLETGIIATLVLSSESADWDSPVEVAGDRVSVPPSTSYLFEYSGLPGQETGIVIERGAFPWSGGKEGYVWASVYYTQTKAKVLYNVRSQPVRERVKPR